MCLCILYILYVNGIHFKTQFCEGQQASLCYDLQSLTGLLELRESFLIQVTYAAADRILMPTVNRVCTISVASTRLVCFAFHQLLRETSSSLAPKCYTLHAHKLVANSASLPFGAVQVAYS